ncbi:MAG: major capsid protein [Actinomycetota bacterium]|nr:major capsid protein [Actinomycetota bacterium]
MNLEAAIGGLVAAGILDEATGRRLAKIKTVDVDELRNAQDRVLAHAETLAADSDPDFQAIEQLSASADFCKAAQAELARRLETQESRRIAADQLAASIAASASASEDVAGRLEGTTGRRRLPSIATLSRHQPGRTRPATARRKATVTALTASGAELDAADTAQISETFGRELDRASRTKASWTGRPTEQKSVVRFEYSLEPERQLGDDPQLNARKIEALAGRDALVASGGVCAPSMAIYDQPIISSVSRPVRDSLVHLGAGRGGVRLAPVHSFSSVVTDAPAALWTEANDVNPTSPATKPYATLTCISIQEYLVDAVTCQVKLGQFQRKYFPEQVTSYWQTALAAQARLAEATLLSTISSGSTAVTVGDYEVGASRDALAELDRLAAALRYRNRMELDDPLRVILPGWIYDMFRADLARNLPGDSGGHSERLAVADAEIDGFFSARHLNVTRALDSPTGASPLQGFGPLGAGQATPWPLSSEMFLFPEGNWLFLDGGILDLGIVIDSTLASTNDAILFTESFELAVPRGFDSLAITMRIDPTGASVGTVAPSTITIGS